MKLKGIDVSKHNGKIDWKKVKQDGVKFAMIRMGVGSDLKSQDDPRFEENVKGCESVGIPWGAYLYSYALNTQQAQSELKHALRLLKGKNPTFPIAFDMEDADGYKKKHGMPSNSRLVDICETFLTGIEKAGYYAILYASRSWLENQLKSSKLNKFDKWLAEWNTSPSYKGDYSMWQYTENGIVKGINGYVDMNIGYLDYPAVMSKKKKTKPVASKPKVTSYSIYKVKVGDNLSNIAKRFGVSLNDLKKANPQIKNYNLIYPGDNIKVPRK